MIFLFTVILIIHFNLSDRVSVVCHDSNTIKEKHVYIEYRYNNNYRCVTDRFWWLARNFE
jgi:hypothetical protein